jgi:hypothetical protein
MTGTAHYGHFHGQEEWVVPDKLGTDPNGKEARKEKMQ